MRIAMSVVGNYGGLRGLRGLRGLGGYLGALAVDEGWEFLFVLGQPRFEGAVQAVINPVAIR